MNRDRKRSLIDLFPRMAVMLVLAVLILFSYAKFVKTPYIGFSIYNSTDAVASIFSDSPENTELHLGDVVLTYDDLTWIEYVNTPSRHKSTGETLEVRILRGDQEMVVPWVVPGMTFDEIESRLAMAWLPYVVWLFALLAVIRIRRHDTRWVLFIAFSCLNALWIAAGLNSGEDIFFSKELMRVFVWLSVPVYIHFHWVFPQPLGATPRWIKAAYPLAVLLVVLEVTPWLPSSAFYFGLILAVLVSLALLLLHAMRRPQQRRDLGLLLLAVGLIVMPLVGSAIAGTFGRLSTTGAGALLMLPALPAAYYLVLLRMRGPGFETRANRAIAVLLFMSLLITTSLLFYSVVLRLVEVESSFSVDYLITPILIVGILTLFFYPSFQGWVEKRLLGMSIQPTRILESYSTHILTSLDTPKLAALLKREVLPAC